LVENSRDHLRRRGDLADGLFLTRRPMMIAEINVGEHLAVS